MGKLVAQRGKRQILVEQCWKYRDKSRPQAIVLVCSLKSGPDGMGVLGNNEIYPERYNQKVWKQLMLAFPRHLHTLWIRPLKKSRYTPRFL